MKNLETKTNAVIEPARVRVKGKFLYSGEHKLYVKGTTYGTFKPDETGSQFPDKETIRKDFSMMAEHGFNAVRTYTVPPKHLLDLAFEYELKVMVGLPWEQHLTFLEKKSHRQDIIRRVKEGVDSCHKHPAILCYTIGNEIPAPIVRWYGKEKIENFLKLLYEGVKEVDPEGLVTYVNYPTTEYLNLSFLDFDCFNVYLETPEKLSAYVARLHNLAGDRPLVLAEIGLDSMRNGEGKQAEVLKWQIQTIFSRGCAGMFIFAWTDEWWRGGFEIEDWDFGLVDRQRKAKLALMSVAETMHAVPFGYNEEELPFISVVVCSYNGSATIRDCMEGLLKLDYPRFEVIVVNDGSTDQLATIVEEYPVTLINTKNNGLSSARNTGLFYAKGEIVSYIDDDAYPDPQWLRYIAFSFMNSLHAGVGGPNIAPHDDGAIALCVANAPGGPVHVLSSDEIAEHIPGCNMSFRRKALMEVGGCDHVFRSAGDDVDLCWRIQEAGYTIGYHPSALVWHHRRSSLTAYWRQQKGYGKAEALLEQKWPEKYNGFGHLTWEGRIYGNGWTMALKTEKEKVFHGTWGSALFQSVYQPADGLFTSLPLMPEWYLFSLLLAFTGGLGFLWRPLFWMWVPFALSILIVVLQAFYSASKNSDLPKEYKRLRYRLLIVMLHIIQPVARLYGRITHGLTPWRKRKTAGKWKPAIRFNRFLSSYWSETWHAAEEWLSGIEHCMINLKIRIKRGGDFDKWDLQTTNGIVSVTRIILTIEEHGAGKQFVKMKAWTRPTKTFVTIFIAFLSLSVLAAIDQALIAAGMLAFISFIFLGEYIIDTSITLSQFKFGLTQSGDVWNRTVEEKDLSFLMPEKTGVKLERSFARRKRPSLNSFSEGDPELELSESTN